MRSFLWLFTVLQLAWASRTWASSPAFYPDETDAAKVLDSPSHLWLVQYGYRRHQLAYVVFTARRKPVGQFYGLLDSEPDRRGGRRLYVPRPDGSRVTVPGPIQLFEDVDGRFHSVRQRVSPEQFNIFINEPRPDYSLRSLLRHVRGSSWDGVLPRVSQHQHAPHRLTRRSSERLMAATPVSHFTPVLAMSRRSAWSR